MWRFIVVTFGFLGVAFYELSGGAEYMPGENSIQARAQQDTPTTVAEAAPASENASDRAAIASVEDLRTTRLEQLNISEDSRFEVTLASVQSETQPEKSVKSGRVQPLPTDQDKAALLTAPEGGTAVDAAVAAALGSDADNDAAAEKVWPGAIELFSQHQRRQQEVAANRETRAASATTYASDDIRYVTGNVVNMRSGPGTGYGRITSLSEGTEVAVLEESGNGWLMLRVTETGEEGWMANWLVSEPAR